MLSTGTYAGVSIRPNTIADALVRMYRAHIEHARVMEVALLSASSMADVDPDKVAGLFRKYSAVAYPPGANKQVEVDELVAKKMEDWHLMEEQFRNMRFRPRQ